MPKIKIFPEGEISLATQLRYFRRKLGLSQNEMAAKLGVSQSLYTKLEVNSAQTTPRRIEHFAQALHTTAEFLTTGEGEEAPLSDPENTPRLTDETLTRILTLAMDPQIQAAAEKFAATTNRTQVQGMVTLVKAMILGDV